MNFVWKESTQPDSRLIGHLSNLLNIPSALSVMLIQRGIQTDEEAEAFFNPGLKHLHDPFLMKDMRKAVARIKQALTKGEKIMVYGDYDVDGTTSVATVYSFLSDLTDKIDYYIPDRYKEGYGISATGIEFARDNKFDLIIALDCGIRSVEMVELANSFGIDFIICDHHLPGKQLPEAVAILNPKQSDCEYPYKELSGCGIGFKLIQALAQDFNIPEHKVFNYLDLVSVSIASDLVDMMGENRVLMHYGLRKINEAPCVGLQALLQDMPAKDEYDVGDIVFGIGPRINAAGRVADAKHAVRLLVEKDFHQAMRFAKVLNDHNLERKDKDTEITLSALTMLENKEVYKERKSTVIYGEDWHKGVIGIVASRLIETHYKPTIVFSAIDGILTGSARSVKDFDIHEAIGACDEYVIQFGGHKFAAGLSVRLEDFEKFSERFEQVVRETLPKTSQMPEVMYDAEITLAEIDESFMKTLDRFRPFGPGNMAPVFRSNNVVDTGYSRVLKEKHIKIIGKQGTHKIEGIGFGLGYLYQHIKGNTFDMCYSPEWNYYNGAKSIQLKIRDVKPCN
jgi:single-stranded-DNA-specific exonuclease